MIAVFHTRQGIVTILVVIAALAGCSTYSATRYSISADTVTALRAFRPQTVNVGAFTAAEPGRTEIRCRLVGPIRTPDGEPFEEFIRKALVDELRVAEVYAPTAPVTLTGHVDQLDFSSNSGAWKIALALSSSNGRRLTVTEEYDYGGFYLIGEVACRQAGQEAVSGAETAAARYVAR